MPVTVGFGRLQTTAILGNESMTKLPFAKHNQSKPDSKLVHSSRKQVVIVRDVSTSDDDVTGTKVQNSRVSSHNDS